MTIEINPNQDALHLSLSETTLQQMCNVQKLTAPNRKKIMELLDKALPVLVQGFLDDSKEVQGLLSKNPTPAGFKPVYIKLDIARLFWVKRMKSFPMEPLFMSTAMTLATVYWKE